MKPFNLKEYLKDPSKEVITRDGRTAKIHCTNYCSSIFPIVAEIEGWNFSKIFKIFTIDGHYNGDKRESPNDLFFAPEKHEGWATIYGKFLTGEIFSTKEEAEESVKRCGTKDFVAIAKVEWEE